MDFGQHCMQPITMKILIFLDHREDTSERNDANIVEVKENLIIINGNLGNLEKTEKKVARKLALNEKMSLIENFLKSLGTNLEGFKTYVLF